MQREVHTMSWEVHRWELRGSTQLLWCPNLNYNDSKITVASVFTQPSDSLTAFWAQEKSISQSFLPHLPSQLMHKQFTVHTREDTLGLPPGPGWMLPISFLSGLWNQMQFISFIWEKWNSVSIAERQEKMKIATGCYRFWTPSLSQRRGRGKRNSEGKEVSSKAQAEKLYYHRV